VHHTLFRPFKNEKAFLERDLTLFPDDEDEQGEAASQGDDDVDEEMPPPPPPQQQFWQPPEGYFDPYFAPCKKR
jgi:hypothetical protein